MSKCLIAGMVGGIILHAWSMVSWMALGWHDTTMKDFSDGAAAQTALSNIIDGPGFYAFPSWPEDAKDEAAMAAFEATHAAGPVGMLVVANGGPVMPPIKIVMALLTQVIAALLAAWMLMKTNLGYGGRVGFLLVFALATAVLANIPNWNWWNFPTPFTVVMILDILIGWLLAGLVMARIANPQPAS